MEGSSKRECYEGRERERKQQKKKCFSPISKFVNFIESFSCVEICFNVCVKGTFFRLFFNVCAADGTFSLLFSLVYFAGKRHRLSDNKFKWKAFIGNFILVVFAFFLSPYTHIYEQASTRSPSAQFQVGRPQYWLVDKIPNSIVFRHAFVW